MAQGVAWMARELGVPATIVVPDNASLAKLAAVERLGGRIVRVPWERWWAAVEAGSVREAAEGVEGFFVHPVRDELVMAGNGTIGFELVEELEEIDAVLIPWGGGGLTTGVASALRQSPPRRRCTCASRRRERRSPVRSPPAVSRRPWSSRRRSSTARGRDRSCPRCGSVRRHSWTHRSSSRSRRRPRPSDCSSSAPASSPRARPRCPWRRPSRGARGTQARVHRLGREHRRRAAAHPRRRRARLSQPAGFQGVRRADEARHVRPVGLPLLPKRRARRRSSTSGR